MEKKRICYLVSSLCNEGPVNVMYNIIKNIDFLKFEVSIITFVPEKETTRMHDFSKLPISIYQLSKNKFLNPISLYLRLKDTVNEIEPNVLHAHCPRLLRYLLFTIIQMSFRLYYMVKLKVKLLFYLIIFSLVG